MKRGIAALLAALADDYGRAVIDAGRDGWLRMRAAASAKSSMLGKYYTGTEVKLKSDPNAEWVEVEIGRERGYMKSSYLRTGGAADRIAPAWKTGTVIATNWANMRYGPSTEYQFAGRVPEGETVTIMGLTDENWYYVKFDGEKGFISAKLIALEDEREKVGGSDRMQSSWQSAFQDYILANLEENVSYGFTHVDHDDIPELVIDTGFEAGGCQVITYHNGMLDVLQTERRGVSCLSGKNLLLNSDGNMGYYYDAVYTIRDGKWQLVARGEYDINPGGKYVFNGQTVTKAQYHAALARVYDREAANEIVGYMMLDGVLMNLQKWE